MSYVSNDTVHCLLATDDDEKQTTHDELNTPPLQTVGNEEDIDGAQIQTGKKTYL